MFTSFGRGQIPNSDSMPDARGEREQQGLVRRNSGALSDVPNAANGVVIAQYQTTRVRHMWSSYKRLSYCYLQ